MPMPTPRKDESRDEFMQRCMRMMHKENEGREEKRPQKQMVAICHSKFEEMHKDASNKDETVMEDGTDAFVELLLKKHPEYKNYFTREE